MKAGFVYGVRNPHFPDLIKVGMTENHISQRLGTLSGSSVPGRYELMFLFPVKPVFEAEVAAHRALAAARVDPSKEFFRIGWEVAKHQLEALFQDRGFIVPISEVLPKPPKPREFKEYSGCQWPISHFHDVCSQAGQLREGAIVTLETALYEAGVFNQAHTVVWAMVEHTQNGRLIETITRPYTFRFIRVDPQLLLAGKEDDRIEEVSSWGISYLQATPERALCDYVKVRDRSETVRKLRSGYSTNLDITVDLTGLDHDRLWRLAEAMKMTDLLKTWLEDLPSIDLFPDRFEHVRQPSRRRSEAALDQLPTPRPSF